MAAARRRLARSRRRWHDCRRVRRGRLISRAFAEAESPRAARRGVMSHQSRLSPPLAPADVEKGRSMRPRGATPRPGPPGLSLGHADALALLEILHGCMSCESEEDLRRLFSQLQGLLPFAHACAV